MIWIWSNWGLTGRDEGEEEDRLFFLVILPLSINSRPKKPFTAEQVTSGTEEKFDMEASHLNSNLWAGVNLCYFWRYFKPLWHCVISLLLKFLCVASYSIGSRERATIAAEEVVVPLHWQPHESFGINSFLPLSQHLPILGLTVACTEVQVCVLS